MESSSPAHLARAFLFLIKRTLVSLFFSDDEGGNAVAEHG